MGGYCAIYYAGAIKGIAIAAAPRNPIHPSISEITTAVGNYDYLHRDITSHPVTDKVVLVILDPENIVDKTFYNNVVAPSYPNLTLIEVPYAGHEVLLHLNFTNELKEIIKKVVNEDYSDITIDLSKTSPYRDKSLALKYLNDKSFRLSVFHAGRGLLESKKEKLDNQLTSIIGKALSKISG